MMVDSPARRDRRGRLLWLLLIAQLLLIVAGFAVWRWTAEAPAPPPLSAAGAATVEGPPTLENGLTLAAAQARRWNDDARLLDASMQVDWPWDPPPTGPVREVPDTGWLVYVFAAPWDSPGGNNEAVTLTVLINRLTGEITSQATVGWEDAPAIAAAATPVVRSAGALLTAEAVAGTDFRRACPIERHLSRVSYVPESPFPPHWLVTYRDQREPDRHGLVVRVDGDDGEVLRVSGEAPPCGNGEEGG